MAMQGIVVQLGSFVLLQTAPTRVSTPMTIYSQENNYQTAKEDMLINYEGDS